MTERKKSVLTSVVTAVLVAALAFWLDVDNERLDTLGVVGALCDAFFISSVTVGGIGLLAFANKHGAFDMFSYGISLLVNIRWPWMKSRKKGDKRETYTDYKMRKSAERTFSVGPLIVGGGMLVLAAITLVISKLI